MLPTTKKRNKIKGFFWFFLIKSNPQLCQQACFGLLEVLSKETAVLTSTQHTTMQCNQSLNIHNTSCSECVPLSATLFLVPSITIALLNQVLGGGGKRFIFFPCILQPLFAQSSSLELKLVRKCSC